MPVLNECCPMRSEDAAELPTWALPQGELYSRCAPYPQHLLGRFDQGGVGALRIAGLQVALDLERFWSWNRSLWRVTSAKEFDTM